MEIKRKNTILCDVYLKDNSYTIEEIMGEHTLTLNFLCRNVVDLEIGDYVDFDGSTYKIRHKEKITKRETSLGYEYSVIFYSSKYDLEDVVFFLNGKPEFKKNLDYYTGTARDWLNLIVKNMNREDTGWAAGSCIQSEWITLSFKDKQVGSVLDELVKQLNTEYWISGKNISIGKRKYSSNGLTLGQGEGMGFTELEVSAVDDERPTTVIFPYGSDKNLGPDYGSDYLLLPGGVTELSKNTEKYGRLGQKKIQFDKIYPKGEFIVTARIDETTLQASGIDFNLTDCLLKDVEAIVTFQNGGLAGYDLAIVEGSWDNTLKQFKLKKNTQENALEVPGDIHFAVGDKFIFTGIKMPKVYIDKASEELLKESSIWLEEHSEKRVQLRGKCDEVLFRQQNLLISPGQMVRVYSDQLKIDREIRVTRVKRFIENDNKPSYRYELTISDFLQGNGFKDLVSDIDNIPVEIEDKIKPIMGFTKRRYRDTVETMKMLEKAFLNYSTSIDPISVHTMQLLVGDESLQFRFVSNKTNPVTVAHNILYNNATKILTAPAGILQHMTIGIKSISSSHAANEYKFWDMELYNSPSLVDLDKSYYLYAKVGKTGTTGVFLLSETAIKIDEVAGYYHLLVGVLNSEFEGERSFVELYGFIEILPGRITADRVVSTDGQNFIDFINNAFRIGNAQSYIDYNTKGDEKLRIKGTIIQSESGAESFFGCFRGPYDPTYTYYPGDEVTYHNGANLSTYRYKYPTPSKGNSPENREYWEVVAQGGLGIKETDVLYAISSSSTIAPEGDVWQTDAPAWEDGKYIWSKTKIVYTDGSIVYTKAACITGGKGETGNGISSIVEQYYLSSSATSLIGGYWTTVRPIWQDGWYIWTRSVITYTNGNQVTTAGICTTGGKGEPGEPGEDGGYFEYRYAVNGSRTSPPYLSRDLPYPSGWSTSMPAVGALQYLWCTVAKKKANETLLTPWSTPTRITGYDGVDGKNGDPGPTMVYRGIYDSSKTYYGTSKRVDAVKYNNIYYVARVDAGSGFYGKVPTSTAYWNEFGNQFENVATNLLLAENAAIGSWWHTGGKIVSTLSDGNKITLDASAARIIVESARSAGENSLNSSLGSKITLDATSGVVEARAKNDTTKVACMSPSGIFCNSANTNAVSAIAGIDVRASIVALGYGNVSRDDVWNTGNFLAAFYGFALNSGNAPAYGGYFQNLMAAGFILNRRTVESGGVNLNSCDSFVVGYSQSECSVYLPTDGVIGRIIFFKQRNVGSMKCYAKGGQKIYDDNTVNSYFRVPCGCLTIAIFDRCYINGTLTEAWLVNSINTMINN